MKSGELSKTGKMKNLKLLSLIIALCSVSLISCGGDDNNDEPIPENTTTEETSESNLPDEAKAFVGYWVGSSNGTYCFFDDGTAFTHYENNSYDYKKFGYWTYDIDTKILATTFTQPYKGNAIQWSITLSNENVWTGISVSGTPVTYNKNVSGYFYYMLSSSSWTATDGSTISFDSYYNYGYYSGNLIPINGTDINEGYYWGIPSTVEYSDGNKIEYRLYRKNTSSWGDKYNSAGSGTLTIVNPYSPKKCKLVLTGTISKEYSYDVPQQ